MFLKASLAGLVSSPLLILAAVAAHENNVAVASLSAVAAALAGVVTWFGVVHLPNQNKAMAEKDATHKAEIQTLCDSHKADAELLVTELRDGRKEQAAKDEEHLRFLQGFFNGNTNTELSSAGDQDTE